MVAQGASEIFRGERKMKTREILRDTRGFPSSLFRPRIWNRLSLSHMNLDKQTLLKSWLNPGLNLIIFRETKQLT